MFEGKLLADRVDTVWGTISLVTAERMLLEEALKDPSNKQVGIEVVCYVCLPSLWGTISLATAERMLQEDAQQVGACCRLLVATMLLCWAASRGTHAAVSHPADNTHPTLLPPLPFLSPQFLLVSDSDIPLYDPLTFYQQVRCACCGHAVPMFMRSLDRQRRRQVASWRPAAVPALCLPQLLTPAVPRCLRCAADARGQVAHQGLQDRPSVRVPLEPVHGGEQ